MPRPPKSNPTLSESEVIQPESNTIEAKPMAFSVAELSSFTSADYIDPNSRPKYPVALMLNTKESPNHGLFLKEEELANAQWTGYEKLLNHENTFKPSQKGQPPTKTKGILFNDAKTLGDGTPAIPNIQIVRMSEVLIQGKGNAKETYQLPNGVEFAGRPGNSYRGGEILGLMFAPGNYDLYKEINDASPNNKPLLARRFFCIYFLDDEGNKLHKTPFGLSIHNSASKSFGDGLTAFSQEVASVIYSLTGKPFNSGMKMAEEFLSYCIFKPKFVASADNDSGTYVTITESWESPKSDGSDLQRFFLSEVRRQEALLDREYTQSFTNRFLELNAQFHPVLPSVAESLALPAAPQNQDAETGEDVIDVNAW